MCPFTMPSITVPPTVGEPGQDLDRVTSNRVTSNPGILDKSEDGMTCDRRIPDSGIAVAPVCGACAEFLPLGSTPTVGTCLLHTVPVQLWERACSQYYTAPSLQGADSDDEF